MPREQKTHCPQNHEYTEENTYLSNGYKQCKTCRRERMRERRKDDPRAGGPGVHNKVKTHCPRNHEYTPENTYVNSGKRQCKVCARINGLIQNVKRYGITPADVERMLEEQSNACLICSREFNGDRRPHIDHDHACCNGPYSCGKCVRGLLCTDCNTGLGKFFDRPDLLRAAASYLEAR